MHLSACSNNSCVSTAMGSVLSLPARVFGKIKRALAVDRGLVLVLVGDVTTPLALPGI